MAPYHKKDKRKPARRTRSTDPRLGRGRARACPATRDLAPPPARRLLSAAIVAALAPAHAYAGVGTTQITPDGRTRTTLERRGPETDISTGTIQGGNAFNSFSRFRVGAGSTVNLQVPDAAHNLINLVHGSRAVVEGVLNSYRHGRIGGNVYFADPYGFVVGRSGVVNVGRLAVSTPSRRFMDRLMGPQGRIDADAVKRLVNGDVPLSPDGVISIQGQVNAVDAVRLHGAQVSVSGTTRVTGAQAHKALFESTVNADGMQQGGSLKVSDGGIEIVAAGDAEVSGTLDAANAGGGGTGGTIRIMAPHVTLGHGATVDASGSAGGGTVRIGGGPHGSGKHSADTVDMTSGSAVHADATGRGDGGSVVLWSEHGTRFAGTVTARGGERGGDGGQVEVSARHGLQVGGRVDTSAPEGAMGNLLLDPTDLYIVNGTGNLDSKLAGSAPQVPLTALGDTVSVGALQNLGNTNITLEAAHRITVGNSKGDATDLNLSHSLTGRTLTLSAGVAPTAGTPVAVGDIVFNANSSIETGGGTVALNAVHGITLNADASINSGAGSGGAGAISLSAPQITLKTGSKLLAQTGAGGAGGNIDLTADTSNATPGIAAADSAITLTGATVKGGDVKLTASATANPNSKFFDQVSTVMTGILGSCATCDKGSVRAAVATASATVDVQSGSVVHAAGDLTVSATTGETASASTDAGTGAAVFGSVKGTPTAHVDNGADVQAGGSLTVQAVNNATLDLEAGVSGDGKLGGALAYGAADVNTTASIAAGATVHADKLSVLAHNSNDFSTSASSELTSATGGGSSGSSGSGLQVGFAVAIDNLNTNAVAYSDANISNANDLLIAATSSADSNSTSAATKVGADPQGGDGDSGGNWVVDLVKSVVSENENGAAALSILSNLPSCPDNNGTPGTGGSSGTKLGSAISVGISHQDAKAYIGAGSKVTVPGQVAVYGKVEDQGLHNVATSAAQSTGAPGTGASTGTTSSGASKGVSAALNFGFHHHSAD
ncbi:MAG TPA: leukotoxin LktA family filamentous adhesin, partial [Gammaproteobacteria bacterium]|nr:leukotoxin LktA family filamentous adhesin [Gammaproteobacteria bacterium]